MQALPRQSIRASASRLTAAARTSVGLAFLADVKDTDSGLLLVSILGSYVYCRSDSTAYSLLQRDRLISHFLLQTDATEASDAGPGFRYTTTRPT